MNVGRESGEEIGAERRRILGRGEEAVEAAAELVGIGGEARWASRVDEGASRVCQNRHHGVYCRGGFKDVVLLQGFGGFGRRERWNEGGGGGGSFTRRGLLLAEKHHLN